MNAGIQRLKGLTRAQGPYRRSPALVRSSKNFKNLPPEFVQKVVLVLTTVYVPAVAVRVVIASSYTILPLTLSGLFLYI
jgi:hypothetical protein